jgi:hypothetical protein
LDRHWRNLRTLFSHNPTPYEARVIGDNFVNGRPLPRGGFFEPDVVRAPSRQSVPLPPCHISTDVLLRIGKNTARANAVGYQ